MLYRLVNNTRAQNVDPYMRGRDQRLRRCGGQRGGSPSMARSCRLLSVMFPLLSNRNLRFPFHFSFNLFETSASWLPSMLSSMTISAPASIASSASASDWTSTSRRREKPPTRRASFMAVVIDPKMRFGFWLTHAGKEKEKRTSGPDVIIFEHDHAR